MAEFKPLKPRLIKHWAKSFADLPSEIQNEVLHAFIPFTWDALSPHQRQQIAGDEDFKRDPANEPQLEWEFDLHNQQFDLNTRRALTCPL